MRKFWTPSASVLAFVLSCGLSGCAKGERQVDIEADVIVGVFDQGKPLTRGKHSTPTLQADAPHVLELRAEGYEPASVTFTPHASGSNVALYACTCIVFPPALLLLPVWLSCGAFNEFEPPAATVQMKPLGAGPK